MKQNHPTAFQDLCLFSEICLILAEYSFRLFSRRFIQELFMDVNYDDLGVEPHKILGLKFNSSVPAADEPGVSGGNNNGLERLAEIASDDALSPPNQ